MAGVHPAPVITTERLILRGYVPGDFDVWYDVMCMEKVHAHLGPAPTREDIFRRLAASVGQWSLFDFGGWMVEERESGKLVGNTGFFKAMRGLGFDEHPEMGWIFHPDVHGKGVAREACEAALTWMDDNHGLDVWAIISPGNEGSFKLAERLGFEIVDRVTYGEEQIDRLSRSAR